MVRSGTKPRPRCSIASAQPARRRQMRPEDLISGEGTPGSGPRSATRLVILRNPAMYAQEKAGSIQRLLALADTPWPPPLGGLCNKRSLLAVRNLASALVAVLRRAERARGRCSTFTTARR